MFIIKFMASILLIAVCFAVVVVIFFWNSIRNIKQQFDRLARRANPSATQSNRNEGQHAYGKNKGSAINTDEGEYVDFEETT